MNTHAVHERCAALPRAAIPPAAPGVGPIGAGRAGFAFGAAFRGLERRASVRREPATRSMP
jgi:hypothetical protein